MTDSNPNVNLDSLCDAFEHAWQNGDRPSISHYLGQITNDQQRDLFSELLKIELWWRRDESPPSSIEDYKVLFPDFQDSVELAFQQFDERSLSVEDVAVVDEQSAPSKDAIAATCLSPVRSDEPELAETYAPEASGSVSDFKRANSVGEKSRQIGPYKLLHKLGAGGMGEVWMAEQSRPVRRRVALKLIKAGAANKQIVARFEAERQALAMMRHENIAAVYDGGETDDGLPYFVMELVQGVPLTEYCDKGKLSINQRLDLFRKVCDAVQHAHQKGIIHRDLKPSNILVCQYDGIPVPKVIDFGLVKATEQHTNLTDKTMFTEFGQVMGTLQYMSPEQAEMNQLGVDTRTDIYSLGVILYELLTGSTPLDDATLKQQALMQVMEMIRTREPPRPSSRLSNSSDQLEGISRQRQIDPKRLHQILDGDLDWIVMKAIEKDRDRRYPSASSFADDVFRFINNDAVEARPPSLSYRATKAIRKHKAGFIAGATIACLLVAGLIGTGTMWFVAEGEAEKAKEAKTRERVAHQQTEIERDQAKNMERQALLAKEETEATLARSNFLLALSRWEANRAGEARKILENIPEKFRNVEWLLANREFQGGLLTCVGHDGPVRCVQYHPTLEVVVSGGDDGTIRFWDATTGHLQKTIHGHADTVSAVAYTPDGDRIVSASWDHKVHVWDNYGRKLGSFDGHTWQVYCVAIAPSGEWAVSGGADNSVRVWDLNSGKAIHTLNGHKALVNSVSISPDASQIASSGTNGEVRIWDSQTGEEVNMFDTGSLPCHSISFLPTGDEIVCAAGEEVGVWNTTTGETIRAMGRHRATIQSVCLSSDGAMAASASEDTRIRVWDTKRGTELYQHRGHAGRVNSVSMRKDGKKVASCSEDGSVRIWQTDNASSATRVNYGDRAIHDLAFSPDGETLIVAANGSTVVAGEIFVVNQIRFLRATDGTQLNAINRPQDAAVWCVTFRPGGRQLAFGGEGAVVYVWDVENRRPMMSMDGHANRITEIRYSPDGRLLASASKDQSIRIWNADTGSHIVTLSGHKKDVISLDFSADSKRLVSSGFDDTIRVWDVAEAAELNNIEAPIAPINAPSGMVWRSKVRFSNDGRFFTAGCSDGVIRIWDSETCKVFSELVGHKHVVSSVCFNAQNDRILSTGMDGTMRIWDVNSGIELWASQLAPNRSRSLALSPDQRRLALGASFDIFNLGLESSIASKIKFHQR